MVWINPGMSGLTEILKGAFVKEREASSLENPEILVIENRRWPSKFRNDLWLYEDLTSNIYLFPPIKDFKGNKNSILTVKTSPSRNTSNKSSFWKTTLEDEKGFILSESREFGELKEYFYSDYSNERLNKMLYEVVQNHEIALRRIEDLYWQRKEIPKDFFWWPVTDVIGP